MDDLRTDDRVIARADDQPVTVRFPPGLVAQLDVVSKRAGRSRNTEIVLRLAKSLKTNGAENLNPENREGVA